MINKLNNKIINKLTVPFYIEDRACRSCKE